MQTSKTKLLRKHKVTVKGNKNRALANAPLCSSEAVWQEGTGGASGSEGASPPSSVGGLLLSWPTGGGQGRSLITLISTEDRQHPHRRQAARREKKQREKEKQRQSEETEGRRLEVINIQKSCIPNSWTHCWNCFTDTYWPISKQADWTHRTQRGMSKGQRTWAQVCTLKHGKDRITFNSGLLETNSTRQEQAWASTWESNIGQWIHVIGAVELFKLSSVPLYGLFI